MLKFEQMAKLLFSDNNIAIPWTLRAKNRGQLLEKGEKKWLGISLKMQCIFTKKMQSIVVVRSKVALTLTSKSNILLN